jgi:hypothetical protein
MKTNMPIEQLLRWRLSRAEAEAPPAPRAARLLALARPWWETWPEQFRSMVERLGKIQIAYGHAMAEPRPSRGGHPVPALIIRTREELETSVRVLYLNVRAGRLRLRFQVDAPLGQEQNSLDVTFVCNTSQRPVVSARASLSVDNEYRIDVELPEELARNWEPLKVTDRMPFRLILRTEMNQG